jgi:hypothetical protein
MTKPKSPRCKRLQAELNRFTYIVGTRLIASDCSHDGFVIEMQVPYLHDSNTRKPVKNAVCWGRTFELGDLFYSNGRVRAPAVKSAVLLLTRGIELHEIDEWLRYDGKPLHSPHFLP